MLQIRGAPRERSERGLPELKGPTAVEPGPSKWPGETEATGRIPDIACVDAGIWGLGFQKLSLGRE